MSRPFLVKDIALQAGVSAATVDRVVNRRGGVREHTARRVDQAIDELEKQRSSIGLAGRKFIIDLVMEAPERFSNAVRDALDAEMPLLRPAVFRARYHLAERRGGAHTADLLDRIARRGTNGVLVKAADVPQVNAAVDRLTEQGIPVVTLVTDLPTSRRLDYVGIDNRAAGSTAAFLVGEWLAAGAGTVLVTLGSNRFRGEEERETGFRRTMRERYPHLGIVEVSEGYGIDRTTGELVRDVLDRTPDITAVYSAGGGNAATIDAFRNLGRTCRVFVGHDLDTDNRRLLTGHMISAVIDHDLRADMQTACRRIMQAHRLLPKESVPVTSNIHIVTPFNMPLPAHV